MECYCKVCGGATRPIGPVSDLQWFLCVACGEKFCRTTLSEIREDQKDDVVNPPVIRRRIPPVASD